MCGAWIIIYHVYIKNAFGGLFWSPAGSRRAARGTRICEVRLSNLAIDVQ